MVIIVSSTDLDNDFFLFLVVERVVNVCCYIAAEIFDGQDTIGVVAYEFVSTTTGVSLIPKQMVCLL